VRPAGADGGDAEAAFSPSAPLVAGDRYVLRLFITGMTPRSTEALRSIRSVCESRLSGRYDLEVIDVYEHPGTAREEQIVAIPTLVKKLPLPARKLIGDMSDTQRVLLGLDLRSS